MRYPNPLADAAPADAEDLDLIRLVQSGSKEALGLLITWHQRWIYNIALRMVYQPQDAEDATQGYLRPWAGKIRIPRYEIINPQVVTDGSLAALSYNLVNYVHAADGSETVGSRWNSTQVYRRTGDQWRVVHVHWSFTKHPAFENMSPEATEGLTA